MNCYQAEPPILQLPTGTLGLRVFPVKASQHEYGREARLTCYRIALGYTFFEKIRANNYVTQIRQIPDQGIYKTALFKRRKKCTLTQFWST